jgi:hypothetical protein
MMSSRKVAHDDQLFGVARCSTTSSRRTDDSSASGIRMTWSMVDGALLVGFELLAVGAACATGSASGGEVHLEVEDGVVLGAAALDFDCCVEDWHVLLFVNV